MNNNANLINLRAYETIDDGYAYLVTYYVDSAKEENRLGYQKVKGFASAQSALKAGYEVIFQNEDSKEWAQANYRSNPNKKTYTYIGE